MGRKKNDDARGPGRSGGDMDEPRFHRGESTRGTDEPEAEQDTPAPRRGESDETVRPSDDS